MKMKKLMAVLCLAISPITLAQDRPFPYVENNYVFAFAALTKAQKRRLTVEYSQLDCYFYNAKGQEIAHFLNDEGQLLNEKYVKLESSSQNLIIDSKYRHLGLIYVVDEGTVKKVVRIVPADEPQILPKNLKTFPKNKWGNPYVKFLAEMTLLEEDKVKYRQKLNAQCGFYLP